MALREWFKAKIAAAMPWLYLILRRAPIATLTAALVAVLFFIVPQSREVLPGRLSLHFPDLAGSRSVYLFGNGMMLAVVFKVIRLRRFFCSRFFLK